jgi:hypothetical protein
MPSTPIFNIPWTEDADLVKDWPTLSKAIAEAVEAACGVATSVPQVTPPGAMTQFAGDKQHIPAGWLVCDGSSYSSNPAGLYYNLYKAISTRFGSDGAGPDGFDRFKVPNMNGLFPRGVINDAGIGNAGKGGSDNAVVVNHTHSGSGTTASGGHHAHNAWCDSGGHHAHGANTNHPFVGGGAGGQTGLLYTGGQRDNYGVQGISVHGGGDHTHGIGIHGGGDHSHTFSVTTGNPTSGTDGTGKNVPSYMPMYYIIKI